MRGLLGTTFLATAALTAAVALYVGFTVPPRALRLEQRPPAQQVTGAYHVHTVRSDGTGTMEDVAEAASRAGLSFVIVTDHGDGTRVPDPPAYLHGVLCIDALEINTTAGHVVALGLSGAAPYPLAGHPRDVIEDIHRLGGAAILAHPDSPSMALRWRGQQPVAFDGIEWLNADSEWRDEPAGRLITTVARSFFRGPESIAALFGRPSRTLERWDAAASRRAVFGVAALDAHASIAWRDREEPRRRTILARPTYEAMFRTVAQSVALDAPFSGNAASDATTLLGAIRAGASFSVVRALADPAALEFTADSAAGHASMGGRLDGTSPLTTIRAAVPGAPGARLTLVANGRPIRSGVGSVEFSGPVAPAVYRVEVNLPGGGTVPWIVSNPITIGMPQASLGTPEAPAMEEGPVLLLNPPDMAWSVEREPESAGAAAIDEASLRLRYRLAGGAPRGQYAAAVAAVTSQAGVDRVQFTGRADRPMRLSVQVRLPGTGEGQRWRRSVYLDQNPRRISVGLQEFEPADGPTSRQPNVAPVKSLLFVVDTLNTLPGSEGVVWISDIALGTRMP